MIARVWRGVVAPDRADDYVEYVDATGVAEYRAARGCRVAAVLTREIGPTGPTPSAVVEVTAFSIWDGVAELQAFTGENVAAMVLYPEDEDYLLAEPTLEHHRVAALTIRPTEEHA